MSFAQDGSQLGNKSSGCLNLSWSVCRVMPNTQPGEVPWWCQLEEELEVVLVPAELRVLHCPGAAGAAQEHEGS